MTVEIPMNLTYFYPK